MNSYYAKKLSAERLQRCYNVATPRVEQYLLKELQYVLDRITPEDLVLELGCGYGRVMRSMCEKARLVIGVDTSPQNIEYGHHYLEGCTNYRLFQMNAVDLTFPDGFFDVVACIQNGICAFHVDKKNLLQEAIRVTRDGGTVLFSSYSQKFWDERLRWFYLQAQEGLLGEIDEDKTGDGVIVCRDGFQVTTQSPESFQTLASEIGFPCTITEVDESSVFCEIAVKRSLVSADSST